jgi:hypothetical protein
VAEAEADAGRERQPELGGADVLLGHRASLATARAGQPAVGRMRRRA